MKLETILLILSNKLKMNTRIRFKICPKGFQPFINNEKNLTQSFEIIIYRSQWNNILLQKSWNSLPQAIEL